MEKSVNSPTPRPDSVTDAASDKTLQATPVERPVRLDAQALPPLEWLLSEKRSLAVVKRERAEEVNPDSDRCLARLVQFETRAETDDERQHWRQCFITVSLAAKGSPIPFVEASLICYGLHPDKLWPALVAKRKALLGREYSLWYDAAGNLRPDAPAKKDSASVGSRKTEVA